MVDAHVHYFQTGFFDSRPDALDLRKVIPYTDVQAKQKKHPERYHEAYLRSGITAVYDVGGFGWSIDLQKQAENDLNAPHVAASGSLLTPASPRLIANFNTPSGTVMVNLASEAIGRRVVAENSSRGATGIKIWAMQPNNPAFMKSMKAVADEVKKRGNKLIVHSTSLSQAKAALKLNAKLLVHSVDDREVDQEFIDLMKKNGTLYNPTLVVSNGYYRTRKAVLGEKFKFNDPNNVIDIDTKKLIGGAERFQPLVNLTRLKTSVERSKARNERRYKTSAVNLKKLFDAGVLIVVGTDAGNPGTLPGVSFFDELEKMQEAGIPAKALIVMATKNGAMAMERSNDFGTLEAGKMADLIILEKNPSTDITHMRSITHVMRGGKLRSVKEKFGNN